MEIDWMPGFTNPRLLLILLTTSYPVAKIGMEESLTSLAPAHGSSDCWYFLAVAVVVTACNQMQRFSERYAVIGFIASGSSMLDETNTSSVEYGLLSGATFLLVYAACAMPVVHFRQSWAVDHIRQLKWILLFGCLGFNVATGLTALAVDFTDLVWPRALLAFFSTMVDPTLYRMLAFHFPPAKRGAASGILFFAVYLGCAVSALTLILTMGVGSWRLSFLIVAVVDGVLCCGAVVLLLRNVPIDTPPSADAPVKQSLSRDLRELCKSRTLVLTMFALFTRYLASFGRGFFEGPYFTQTFPTETVVFTVLYSVFLMLAPVSLYVGGWLSDIKEQSKPQWRPLICAVTCWVSMPFLIMMYLTDVFWVSMLALAVVYGVGETFLSVSFAMLINVTTPRIRALRKCHIETGWMLLNTCVAGVVSTLCLGVAGNSQEGLRYGLLSITLTGYGLGGLIFFVIAHFYPKDLARESEIKAREESFSAIQ